MLKPEGNRKRPQDVVGVDLGNSGVKAVRLRNVAGQLQLVAAGVFPRVSLVIPARLELPKEYSCGYLAMAYTAPSATVRVLAVAGVQNDAAAIEQALRSQMGLDASYRIRFNGEGGEKDGQGERFFAVACNDAEVRAMVGLYARGRPALWSLEVSGLAALASALDNPLAADRSQPLCLMEFGEKTSFLAIMSGDRIALARKFDVGAETVIDRIQKMLGVTREIAESVLREGAIDISKAIREAIDPFLRQVMISREFVERSENCRVTRALVTGGLSMCRYWRDEVQRVTGMTIDAWDPFSGIDTGLAADGDWAMQRNRFSAAVAVAREALLGK